MEAWKLVIGAFRFPLFGTGQVDNETGNIAGKYLFELGLRMFFGPAVFCNFETDFVSWNKIIFRLVNPFF